MTEKSLDRAVRDAITTTEIALKKLAEAERELKNMAARLDRDLKEHIRDKNSPTMDEVHDPRD
jgi:hypothetical protein